MNDRDAIYSADPERLKRLVDMGLLGDELDDDAQAPTVASVGGLLERVGSLIGRYELLECIGEGGMGIVYLAEQVEPIRRHVALKLVKPGMDSKQVIARFEAERQALALLDHPYIAHVYDAGTTDHGRPYFVMEYVKGHSITDYCDQNKLNIRARIALFQKVCGAVAYAHRKGIIHRDLKPSNILISTDQGQEDPKIIDFGVSKAISQPLTQQTLYTDKGHWVGTPEYMSPEQALRGGQEIGNRSDIYSLGVVLYQLLSGVLPFDIQSIRAEGVDRVRQVICEEDPKTPSTKLSSLTGEQCRELAMKRGTDYKSLGRVLNGDLDWITLKALEKHPDRRYATADDLAADLNRSLRHEPIVARPIGAVERSLRRIRRYPWATATAASILVALLMTGLLVRRYLTPPVEPLVLQDVESLAVLPFRNDSGNSDYEDIIEGVTLLLLDDLATLPQLNVVNGNSAQQVDVNLQGRVNRDGYVHIELIAPQSRRSSSDLLIPFPLQDVRSLHKDIAQWVTDKLRPAQGRALESAFDKRYSPNLEAHKRYVRGRRAFGKFSSASMKEAIVYFKEAIEIDKTFALGYAGLANVYVAEGIDLLPPREMFSRARGHANRAFELDPNLAETHVALASIAYFSDRDFPKAERHLERALALNPMSIEMHACLMHGRDASNPNESLPFVKALLAENPHSLVVMGEVACASYYAGEYVGSIEYYSKIREINPSYNYALWGLGRAHAQLENYTEALKFLEQGREPLDGWSTLISELGYVYAMAKQGEKAEEMLALLASQSADGAYVDPYLEAMVYVGLGKHTMTLSKLNDSVEVDSTWLPWLRVEPKFKPLHHMQEFKELLESVGLGNARPPQATAPISP